MMTHDELIDALPLFVVGDLEAAAAAEVAQHLRICSSCLHESERLTETVDLVRELTVSGPTVGRVDGGVDMDVDRRPRPWPSWARAACLVAAFSCGVATQWMIDEREPRSPVGQAAPLEPVDPPERKPRSVMHEGVAVSGVRSSLGRALLLIRASSNEGKGR